MWSGILAPLEIALRPEQVPACCRRDGKHHCAMRVPGHVEDQSSAFRAKSETCPYRAANVARCGGTLSLPGTRSFVAASPKSYFLLAAQLDIVSTLHLITHLERGPPSFS